MANILNELNEATSQSNLWTTWEQELSLRRQLRTDPGQVDGLRPSTAQELDFVHRALYFSPHRSSFWSWLYQNRDSSIVAFYLAQKPATFTALFFTYLAEVIAAEQPAGRDLQFLISLFREELKSAYRDLIVQMNAGQCAYLEARTTNPLLRRMLQDRLDELSPEPESKSVRPALSESGPEIPGLYGGQLTVVAAATDAVDKARSLQSIAPWQTETIEAVLYASEMLFRAGLIADCLLVASDLLRQADNRTFSQIADPDGMLHKTVRQLLRKAIPVYCLLAQPVDPHGQALALYRSRFPGFKPDPGSLLYLDIYTIALSSLLGFNRYGYLELVQRAAGLHHSRPDDALAQILLNWHEPSQDMTLEVLEQVVSERFSALPHEAFTAMNLIRLAQREAKLDLDPSAASRLLQNYMRLFNWIPAETFMNEELLQEISPLADDSGRRSARAMLRRLENQADPGQDQGDRYKDRQPGGSVLKKLWGVY
ncbi:MAG: hypothetical protein ABRQ23_03545 [Syntrophomonadaceae bacterium]